MGLVHHPGVRTMTIVGSIQSFAGRMLSWGVGWTLGSVTGGVIGSHLGVRPAMLVLGIFAFTGVLVAWTSPLRRLAAGPDPFRA